MPCKLNFDALKKLSNDPSQTEIVFDLLKYSCKNSYRRAIQTMTYPLKKRPKLHNLFQSQNMLWPLDLSYLRSLPEQTLGHQYVLFLDRNQLKSKYSSYQVRIRSFTQYIKKQLLESHDLWHVLCGYDTSLKGEIAVHAFSLAQVQSSLTLVTLAGFMLKLATDEPESIHEAMQLLCKAYQQGLSAKNLLEVDWHTEFDKPLDLVRQELGICV